MLDGADDTNASLALEHLKHEVHQEELTVKALYEMFTHAVYDTSASSDRSYMKLRDVGAWTDHFFRQCTLRMIGYTYLISRTEI